MILTYRVKDGHKSQNDKTPPPPFREEAKFDREQMLASF